MQGKQCLLQLTQHTFLGPALRDCTLALGTSIYPSLHCVSWCAMHITYICHLILKNNPSADTIMILVLQIMAGIAEIKSFGQGDTYIIIRGRARKWDPQNPSSQLLHSILNLQRIKNAGISHQHYWHLAVTLEHQLKPNPTAESFKVDTVSDIFFLPISISVGLFSMCGCLSCTPQWGLGLQPRHVPWLGIKPATLWSQARAQSTELHQPGL